MRYSFKSVSVLSNQSSVIPSTPAAVSTVGSTGTTPSIASDLLPLSEVALPGVGNVSTALLPTRSLIVPLPADRDAVSLMSSRSFKSPVATTYLKTSVEVPLPDT